MTSAVKSAGDRRSAGAVGSSLLPSRVSESVSSHQQRRSLYTRRSIMLISVGWVPQYWCPSRRLLRSRLEGRGLVTRSKIAPKTGAASPPVARVSINAHGPSAPRTAAGPRAGGYRDSPSLNRRPVLRPRAMRHHQGSSSKRHRFTLEGHGSTGTCRAIAHANAAISRAIRWLAFARARPLR